MAAQRIEGIRHLLVRAPNWVGDLVMATPMLTAAVADPRFERVSIVLREHLVAVLADGPCAEHVVAVTGRADETRRLREAGADAALLLTTSLGSAWRAFRAGIPLRFGAALAGRSPLLTHRVVPPRHAGRRVPIPTAELMRDVSGLLGIEVESLQPRLHVPDALRSSARRELEAAGLGAGEDYVLCAPSAAFGAAKLWPPEHHAAVLDGLHREFGWRGVVTGGPGEEPQIEAVVSACQHAAISLSDTPRDLARLKAWVADTRLLLVGDSGPRWFAAAYEIPCVSIMGPNFPELTASSLEWCEIVRHQELECAPCLERRCPLGHHRCMRDLLPERALQAARELLARRAS